MLAGPRLDLIPLTRELAAAERAGTRALAEALAAAVAADWPPEFYEPDDLDHLERLLADERNAGWTLYYLIRRAPPPRVVVGVAGFNGRPSPDGTVEIGYGVLPAHRGMGLASEAVAALLAFAFGSPAVETVVAETFAHLPASIAVLLRAGFQLDAESGRGGSLRYQRSR